MDDDHMEDEPSYFPGFTKIVSITISANPGWNDPPCTLEIELVLALDGKQSNRVRCLFKEVTELRIDQRDFFPQPKHSMVMVRDIAHRQWQSIKWWVVAEDSNYHNEEPMQFYAEAMSHEFFTANERS